MKDLFFGDIHFSAQNPWNYEAGECFIQWFCNEFKNRQDSRCWFLGDLSDKDQNPGDVVDQLYRLINFASNNFSSVYLLMGNHDLKLYRGRLQHALKFLRNLPNVEVIETVVQYNFPEDDKTILALPHQRVEGKTIESYYNTFDFSIYSKSDIAIGHWAIKDDNSFYKGGVDLSHIPADKVICGHIHIRPRQEYTGSIWPCNVGEVTCKYPRCYKTFLDDKTLIETPLPEFLVYNDVNFPDDIKAVDNNAVNVYTVSNISNLNEAKAHYKDYYIRGIVRPKAVETDEVQESEFVVYENNLKALDAMMKETKLVISRQAFRILAGLLS